MISTVSLLRGRTKKNQSGVKKVRDSNIIVSAMRTQNRTLCVWPCIGVAAQHTPLLPSSFRGVIIFIIHFTINAVSEFLSRGSVPTIEYH